MRGRVTRTLKRLIVAGFLTTIGAAACSGDEASPAEDVVALLPASPTSPLTTEEERSCAASAIADQLGAQRLESLGVGVEGNADFATAPLTDAELETIGEAVVGCAPAEYTQQVVDDVISAVSVTPDCAIAGSSEELRLRVAGALALGRDPMLSESFFEGIFDAEQSC